MISRRGIFKFLLTGAALVAASSIASVIILESEPVKQPKLSGYNAVKPLYAVGFYCPYIPLQS